MNRERPLDGRIMDEKDKAKDTKNRPAHLRSTKVISKEITKACLLEETAWLRRRLAVLQKHSKEFLSIKEDLRKTNARLISLIQAVPDPIYFKDTEGRNRVVNRAFEKMLGRPQAEIIGKTDREILPSELAEQCQKSDREALTRGEAIRFDEQSAKANGSPIYFETRKAPIFDEKGKPLGLVGISRDITHRKRIEQQLRNSLKEKEVLLKEIHHRVKNNMQIISSLLNVQAHQLPKGDISEMFKECQHRIRSMALIHEKLYQSKDLSRVDFSSCLRSLASFLFQSYRIDAGRVRLTIDAEMIYLNINSAIPLGLVVNELVSNALKHAFPEGRSGEIVIGLHRLEEGRFVLRIKDDGVGFPENLDFCQTPSLGMQMVMTLVNQIDGKIDLFRGRGTDFQIVFRELKAKSAVSTRTSEAMMREVEKETIEGMPDPVVLTNLEGEIIYSNKAYSDVFGQRRDASTALSVLEVAGKDASKIKEGIKECLAKGFLRNLEITAITGDKGKMPVLVNAVVSRDSKGQPKCINVVLRDISELKRMEKIEESIFKISDAAISAENLKELFRSIHKVIEGLMPAKNFYIALYDAESEILHFPYFVDEYDETPAPRKTGKGLTEYVLRTGEALLASPEVFKELVRKGEVEPMGTTSIDWLGVPLKMNAKNIGVLVVQSYAEGVRYGEEEKNILRFVSDQIAMVIERKRGEETVKTSLREKEVLLREIHHRVKNNMQIISSLLNLQITRIKDENVLEMFKESQRRIRSMALVHERLYQSTDFSRIEFSEYLRSLAIHLFHSYQVDSRRINLKIDADEVYLNINTAIPCGLIVNELVSNALKHAFPQGRSGEVSLSLHRAKDNAFILSVKDNGVGLPKGLNISKTETLGLQIIDTLVHQINGTAQLVRDKGTEFRIEFKELKIKSRN